MLGLFYIAGEPTWPQISTLALEHPGILSRAGIWWGGWFSSGRLFDEGEEGCRRACAAKFACAQWKGTPV